MVHTQSLEGCTGQEGIIIPALTRCLLRTSVAALSLTHKQMCAK